MQLGMPLLRRSLQSRLTTCSKSSSISVSTLSSRAILSPSPQQTVRLCCDGIGGRRIKQITPAQGRGLTHHGMNLEAQSEVRHYRFNAGRNQNTHPAFGLAKRWRSCTFVALPEVSPALRAESREFSTNRRLSTEKVGDDSLSGTAQVKGSKRRYQFFSKSDDDEMLRLRSEGYSWRKIADHLKRHKDSCESHYYNHLKYCDVSRKAANWAHAAPARNSHKQYTPEEDRLIVELKRRGMRSGAIGRRLQRSMHAINQRYQYFIRDGAAGEAFHTLKAQNTDSLGRKRRKEFTRLEALTIVYLRGTLGLSWIDIVEQFPQRTANCLRNTWHRRLQPRYGDIVDSDPREWNEEKLRAVFAKGMVGTGEASDYRTT